MQHEVEQADDDPESSTREKLAEEIGRDLIEQCGSEKEAYQEACRLIVLYASAVSPGYMRIGQKG